MIYAHLLILIALLLAGMYVAHKARVPALYVILSVLLLLGAVGIWSTGLYPSPGDVCLNNTQEDSLYWPCNHTVYEGTSASCTGQPEPDSCAWYDAQQCADIDGCNWDTMDDECMGTPTVSCGWLYLYDTSGFKCQETPGCLWTPGALTPSVVNATCDSVNVTYNYDYCQVAGKTQPEQNGALWAGTFVMLCLLLLSMGIIEFMGGQGGATTQAGQSAARG